MPLFRDSTRRHTAGHTDCHPDPATASTLADNLRDVLKAAAPGRIDRRSDENADEDEDSSDFNEATFSPFSFMKQAAEESLKRVIPAGCVCVVPFVYLYVSQPHCLLANHSADDLKVEASCYDMLVKGATDRQVRKCRVVLVFIFERRTKWPSFNEMLGDIEINILGWIKKINQTLILYDFTFCILLTVNLNVKGTVWYLSYVCWLIKSMVSWDVDIFVLSVLRRLI